MISHKLAGALCAGALVLGLFVGAAAAVLTGAGHDRGPIAVTIERRFERGPLAATHRMDPMMGGERGQVWRLAPGGVTTPEGPSDSGRVWSETGQPDGPAGGQAPQPTDGAAPSR